MGKDWLFPQDLILCFLEWLSPDNDTKQRQEQVAFGPLPQRMCWQPELHWTQQMCKLLPGSLHPTSYGEYGVPLQVFIPETEKLYHLKGRAISKIRRES